MIFNEQIAQQKLNQIAEKHLLSPILLQNIVWGRSQGWSQTRIAQEYNINPNTVSKYSRILEREMNANEIKELLIIIGLILGAGYIIKELFRQRR
ncbi:MAG: hypothetical protein KAT43_01260 [Nanoarchaeota archaeon]|nr:hypothetical protein [Nanoarchaeota archaeon]